MLFIFMIIFFIIVKYILTEFLPSIIFFCFESSLILFSEILLLLPLLNSYAHYLYLYYSNQKFQ